MTELTQPDSEDESDLTTYEIDTPASLRPDLELYDIPEVDRGICVDSYEHRAILRKHKMTWRPIYNRAGELTDLIEVLAQEMREAHSISVIEERRALLVDPRNHNSDYETGWGLILLDEVQKMVPPWVLSQTRTWLNLQEKKAAKPTKVYRTKYTEVPSRCKFIKADGVRCIFWSAGRSDEGGLCRTHTLSKLSPEIVSQALNTARRRIGQNAPAASEVLEDLMINATSEQVRLKAAESLLDRAGIRGGIEVEQKVEITGPSPLDVVMERLQSLKPKAVEAAGDDAADIVDAEIVDEPSDKSGTTSP